MNFQYKFLKQTLLLAGLLLLSLPSTFSQIIDDAMVTIPAGEFTMGCDPNTDIYCEFSPEETAHAVYLDAYQIDKYEVTYRRYQKCVDAGVCETPDVGGMFNYGWAGNDLLAVNGITWFKAKAFCEWEGKRLPTEAEWEKAAKGTEQLLYPWGYEEPTCEYAVMDTMYAGKLGCGTGNIMPVGSKPKGASPYGVMDMAGNVWEWTADWHDEDYHLVSPYQNPKGAETGSYKVTRGGDLFSRTGLELRTTGKFPYYPANPSPAIGFRCVKSL
jgi:formylglycine-generating enzyme required for sulfatase activity